MTSLELTELVVKNPGKTATELGKMVGIKYGTISSALYRLCQKYEIVRCMGAGVRSGEAWRYYPKVEICVD